MHSFCYDGRRYVHQEWCQEGSCITTVVLKNLCMKETIYTNTVIIKTNLHNKHKTQKCFIFFIFPFDPCLEVCEDAVHLCQPYFPRMCHHLHDLSDLGNNSWPDGTCNDDTGHPSAGSAIEVYCSSLVLLFNFSLFSLPWPPHDLMV